MIVLGEALALVDRLGCGCWACVRDRRRPEHAEPVGRTGVMHRLMAVEDVGRVTGAEAPRGD